MNLRDNVEWHSRLQHSVLLTATVADGLNLSDRKTLPAELVTRVSLHDPRAELTGAFYAVLSRSGGVAAIVADVTGRRPTPSGQVVAQVVLTIPTTEAEPAIGSAVATMSAALDNVIADAERLARIGHPLSRRILEESARLVAEVGGYAHGYSVSTSVLAGAPRERDEAFAIVDPTLLTVSSAIALRGGESSLMAGVSLWLSHGVVVLVSRRAAAPRSPG